MRRDPGYFEEATLGKSENLKLIRGLGPYARPYRGIILWSILLVILTAFIDLAIPYITKTAIDRYIVPRTSSTSPSKDAQAGQRMLKVDLRRPGVPGVVERHPQLFTANGSTAAIPYDALKDLEKADLRLLRKPDLNGVTRLAVFFLVLIALNFALGFYQRILMEYAGHMMMNDLRLALYNHIQRLSISFFTRNPVGRLVTRVTNDVQNMHELFTSVITFVFQDLFLLAGIAAVLMVMNWRLALVSFMILPLVLYTVFIFSGRIRGVFRELRIKVAEINTHFSETIAGIRVIQSYRSEKASHAKFARLNHDNFMAGMRQIHIMAVFMPLIELFGVLTIAVIVFYGGNTVIRETVSLGTLVAFIAYMRMFFRPIRDLAEKYNILQNAMASAERIFLIMENTNDASGAVEKPADTTAAPKARPVHPARFSSLTMDNVSFGYHPPELILKNINLQVAAGETLAIVGPTGSGKTSLINLITRFYAPTSGRILINGRALSSLPLDWTRSLLALVTQEPFLFSDTIRANIWTDGEHIDDAEIDRVLTAANCRDFVDRLPQGIDTRLAGGGESISSGERQLICLARAFARNPELIILDEATSYIDSETETRIQEAVARLMKNRTAIVVAHRLSTVRSADRILVLDRGRIVETGSHDQLMDQRGFYYRLSRLQNDDAGVKSN